MAQERFQNAIKKIPQKVPPIWFMRQAGRYHSHYQGLRSKYSFEQMCKIPELAAEVAWGPIQDFDFDVAILFSDILFPLEALGFGLKYTEQGPRLGFHLNEATIKDLKPANDVLEFLNFQGDAMKMTRDRLPQNKSLIGFVGGPWTLFVYACEGSHAGSLTSTKSLLPLISRFNESLLALHEYTIQRQLAGGAEVVMIFDTAAGELSPALFEQFVLPSLERLSRKFPGQLGYYSKATQSSFITDKLLNLPWAGLGFDHRWSLPELLKFGVGPHQIGRRTKSMGFGPGFVQGNFDQSLLHADTESFKKYLSDYIKSFQELTLEERAGWVSGLGHGVLPKTPEAHVKMFVEKIRESFS